MYKRISVHFEDTAAFNQFSSISIHLKKYGPMRWAMAPGQSLSDEGPLIVPDITTDVWLKALWVNGDVSSLNLNVHDTTMVVAFNTISRERSDWSTNKMNCPDSDNDGIDDCNDDYPYDSLLAYLVVSEL